MQSQYKSVFSYYGGKSKLVNYYPEPKHDLIIEPFAGSAAYSWCYYERDIWINDTDQRTFSIWSFLLQDDSLDIIRATVPTTVVAGQRVSEMLGDVGLQYPGLVELCRSEANQGTQGSRGVRNTITAMGARCWNIHDKMSYIIPRIAHWTITNHSYELIGARKATWFIDPPYANAAGRVYRQHSINYPTLGEWCESRWGQVMVCENAGATWLPFHPLKHPGKLNIKSRYQKANAKEVIWTRG